ncbi:MAG: U32 family peptidase [Pedobacter sp.]
MKSQPELLAPAGNMEKLETALLYGADAVYVGGEQFGLRAQAGNFTLEQLARARELTLRFNRRLYLTLNAYLMPGETDACAAYLEQLRDLDLDAYIVADPGVLALVRAGDPDREIHLSTQANTTNAEAARFWSLAGVRRINLARELSMEDIRAVRSATDVELEVFVHGAMCVAYSGRCLLSAALTERGANRGLCTQPCRWSYALMEKTRPGQYFPIEEDARGSYLMNSRDLCLLAQLPQLIDAGVDSLKIEGRMKSRYYVAAVTRVYRKALDSYLENPADWRCQASWREELESVSHRPYSTGFFLGKDDPQLQTDHGGYIRRCDFVGEVSRVDVDGRGLVIGRNRFFPGEKLELIGPDMRQASFEVSDPMTEGGAPLSVVQPNAQALLPLPAGAQAGDLLRRNRVED